MSPVQESANIHNYFYLISFFFFKKKKHVYEGTSLLACLDEGCC